MAAIIVIIIKRMTIITTIDTMTSTFQIKELAMALTTSRKSQEIRVILSLFALPRAAVAKNVNELTFFVYLLFVGCSVVI